MSTEFSRLGPYGTELAKKVDVVYTSVLDKAYQLGKRAKDPDTRLLIEAVQDELSGLQKWLRTGDDKDGSCQYSENCMRIFCPCPNRAGRIGG